MKWLWFFLAFLMLLSCRSKKQTSSSNLDEHYIEKMEQFIERRDSLISIKNSIYHLNENVEIIEREFDTDHEPDSAGNYPVKKETVTKINKEGKAEVEENENSGSKTNVKTKDDKETTKKEEAKNKEEVKENSSFKYLIILCILVLIVIIAIFMKQRGIIRK